MKKLSILISITLLLSVSTGWAALGAWLKYDASPTTKDINALKMVTASNGWAVGYWGEVLHYDGVTWSIYTTWPVQYLQDVDFSGADFGFAVGYAGACIQYNGANWSSMGIPSSQSFNAVGIPPGQANVAWAGGGNGHLWRWSGGVWSQVSLGTTRIIHDIYWSSASDGWLCGDYGIVYHYGGTSWSAVSAFTSTTFYCIYALSPTNVWVGGSGGRLYHYEGYTWAQVSTPTSNAIREMAFNGANDGWAVCDKGTVIHYDGVGWSIINISPPTTENFSGMNMLGTTGGWAVGTAGTIYEYRNNPDVAPTSLGRVKAMFN